MLEIEKIINDICPNGVEYKPLWELTAWDKRFNGLDRSMQKKVIPYKYYLSSEFDEVEREDGDVLYISTGTSSEKRYTTEELAGEHLAEGEIVCIPWGGTPNVKYHKGKFVTGDNRIATSLDTNVLDNKFLYYWMQSQIKTIASFYRGAGIQHPSMKSVLEMLVPLPPLAAQREIVHVLDKFTLLSSELAAELAARQEQYKYYRNKLLNFDDIRVVELKDIAEIGTGSHNTNEELEEGDYPFFVRSQDVRRLNTFDFDETAIITSGDGVGVGKIFHYIEGKYALHQRAYRIKIIDNNVNPKYFYYYMKATFFDYIQKTAVNSSVTSIRRPMLEQFKVPVPTIEAQKRLVYVLDNFDTVCSDLKIGLPAEKDSNNMNIIVINC